MNETQDKILAYVKSQIPVYPEQTEFDPQLISITSSVLAIVTEHFGIGPSEGLLTIDANTTWEMLLPGCSKLEMVKMYVASRVKLMFDPPQNSTHMKALENTINELEWRILQDSEDWNTENE